MAIAGIIGSRRSFISLRCLPDRLIRHRRQTDLRDCPTPVVCLARKEPMRLVVGMLPGEPGFLGLGFVTVDSSEPTVGVRRLGRFFGGPSRQPGSLKPPYSWMAPKVCWIRWVLRRTEMEQTQ